MGMLGFSGYKDGPGVHEPPPKKGWKRYKFLVSNHFWRLIRISFFILLCLPFVTIPAVLCGMTSVLMCLARDGNTMPWKDFWKEFKVDFPHRLVVFFGSLLVLEGIGYIPLLFGREGLSSFLSAGLSGIWYVIMVYWMAMVVKVDISVWNAFRNAALLLAIEWKKSLIMLGSFLVYFFIMFELYPYSVILLVLSISFLFLLNCVLANDAINERILPKSEAENKSEDEPENE